MKEKRETFQSKEEYFFRNGAILLEKQISSFHGKGESIRIFSAKDIQKATNNYDKGLILARQIATVYKGTLDDRTVAIKTPQGLNPTQFEIDFFLNQVIIKLQINHKNVVKLLGCCLETQVPILIYEFISNGSLFHNLHGNRDVGPSTSRISWSDRLRIATEIAYVLSYMHCAKSKPIVHMDVNSMNIFLDENYTAKLSNFGFSVPITPGKSFIRLEVQGISGYIDPEYIETRRVTEKCDVYGFGVVMVELLTGQIPTQMFIWNNNLVGYFVSSVKENLIWQVVEGRILEEGRMEEIQEFAELALRCVGENGEERPSMKEVVQELRRIQVRGTRANCLTKCPREISLTCDKIELNRL